MIQEEELVRKLDIHLKFRSKIPLADQVRSAIFDLIQRGALPEDTLLPTVRDLAAQLGVNFNTVARAYRALDKEGWLITRQGRGTVVTRPLNTTVENPYVGMIHQLTEEIQKAAEQFNIDPLKILEAIDRQLRPKHKLIRPLQMKRQRKSSARFRYYHASFPRSRKTRRETLDWRLRKPVR